jgi:hypothetical protein
MRAQTRQVLQNLRIILEEAGLNFTHVVKTTVFLVNLAEFQAMNEVYAEYFHAPFPARSTVQVARLPRDAGIEIEAIARFPVVSEDRREIDSPFAPDVPQPLRDLPGQPRPPSINPGPQC